MRVENENDVIVGKFGLAKRVKKRNHNALHDTKYGEVKVGIDKES